VGGCLRVCKIKLVAVKVSCDDPQSVLFRVLGFGHATWRFIGAERVALPLFWWQGGTSIRCNGGTQLSTNTHRPKSKEPADE